MGTHRPIGEVDSPLSCGSSRALHRPTLRSGGVVGHIDDTHPIELTSTPKVFTCFSREAQSTLYFPPFLQATTASTNYNVRFKSAHRL